MNERTSARAAGDPMRPVGVFGGSFDPVHHGHLRSALEVLESCRLAEMRLIPCGTPPLRSPPVAPAELRLRMLKAAVAAEPRLVVDDRELRRPGPSYTVDTLASLRSDLGERPLCLLLGADAFLGLTSWHRWQALSDLAHIIVMLRPGWELKVGGPLATLLADRSCDDVAALHGASAGVVRVQQVTPLDISSSAIRAQSARGGDSRFLVPDAVRDLIMTSGCYRNSEIQAAGTAAGSTEVQLRA